MKGCARNCLLHSVLYVAVAGAFSLFLQWRYSIDPRESIGAAAGGGLLAWIGLQLLFGIVRLARERAAVLSAASGARPVDGRQAVIAGNIDSPRHRLRAPLSGADCVAYRYEITETTRESSKSSETTVRYEGTALVPSVISTRSGSYRLLSVPSFDFPYEEFPREAAIRNAQAHIAATQFAEGKEARRGKMEHELTDDDGEYHVEESNVTGAVDLSNCQFTERHIKRGERVCVFGLYSEQRGGIVPHPNWAYQTRIMKGDPEMVARKMGWRIVRYFIGGLLFCAAAAGVLYLFISHQASL